MYVNGLRKAYGSMFSPQVTHAVRGVTWAADQAPKISSFSCHGSFDLIEQKMHFFIFFHIFCFWSCSWFLFITGLWYVDVYGLFQSIVYLDVIDDVDAV